MINKCPCCNNNLAVTFPLIFLCKCGYDLRTSAVTFISENETHLSRLISVKLESNEKVDFCNNLLTKMDLISIIYVLLLVTFQVSRYVSKERFAFSKELSIIKIHEITNYVFNIFSDWPNSFLKFIHDFRLIPKAEEHSHGLQKEFGSFYRLFYKQLQGEQYQEVRKQFEHYLITKWDGGYLSDRIINKFLAKVNTPEQIEPSFELNPKF